MIACNILRGQNGSHFSDDIFTFIYSIIGNCRILIKISFMFDPKGQMNNFPSLVQIMACRRTGDKPLSEPWWSSLLTHICATQPQWMRQHSLTLCVASFCAFAFWVSTSFLIMTSLNGNDLRVSGPLWRESTGDRAIPLTNAMTRSFDVFFDQRLNKPLSKQSRRRWFETPPRSLWRHGNVL